jgi:serine/threonine protein kinase
MVVMDFVEEGTEPHLTSQGREDIKRAISFLHTAGYVFGDLRDANVLKLPDGRAMLVDFDWSGKEGQVFYPMGLNAQIEWPAGCGAGVQIQKAHDLVMLQKLK